MNGIKVTGENELGEMAARIKVLGGNPDGIYPVQIVGGNFAQAERELREMAEDFYGLRLIVGNRRLSLDKCNKVSPKTIKAFMDGRPCEPSGGHFEIGSRTSEPNGFGVELGKDKVLRLVEYFPARQDPAPSGTRRFVIAEKMQNS